MNTTENPTTSDNSIIHLRNVALSHSDGPLLKEVNLDIAKGEFVYLIGKSGAGKTSLMRSLYADHKIDSGEAVVCGFDLMHIKRRQIPMLRRQIGIVFQNYRLLKDRNVYENLAFVLRATGWKNRSEIDSRIMKTLENVGISDKAQAMPYQMSEGEQQRVGIARALINNPTLILADEATGNMDPITSSEIIELLQSINRNEGVTMLISSHDFMMIDKFPSRVICCEDGTLVCPQ